MLLIQLYLFEPCKAESNQRGPSGVTRHTFKWCALYRDAEIANGFMLTLVDSVTQDSRWTFSPKFAVYVVFIV